MLKWIEYAGDGKIEFQWGNEIYRIRDPQDVILVGVPLEQAEKWIRIHYGFLLED